MIEQMSGGMNTEQKKRLINAVTAVAILLAVFLGIKSLNALKEGAVIDNVPAANVIAVNGTGEILTVPDVATFSFSVTEQAKTVKDAQDASNKKMKAILDAVKGLGVAEKDIKTTSYNSYPKYEYEQSTTICSNGYCPPGKQVLVGYEVSQTITVKVRKTDDAGTVLAKVGELGATDISGLDFVVDNIDAVQAQARDKAIASAKDKAKVLAKSLGVRLNKIVSFYEAGDAQPIYYSMKADAMGGAASAPVAPQIPVGQNKVVSNVTITYEVK